MLTSLEELNFCLGTSQYLTDFAPEFAAPNQRGATLHAAVAATDTIPGTEAAKNGACSFWRFDKNIKQIIQIMDEFHGLGKTHWTAWQPYFWMVSF